MKGVIFMYDVMTELNRMLHCLEYGKTNLNKNMVSNLAPVIKGIINIVEEYEKPKLTLTKGGVN